MKNRLLNVVSSPFNTFRRAFCKQLLQKGVSHLERKFNHVVSNACIWMNRYFQIRVVRMWKAFGHRFAGCRHLDRMLYQSEFRTTFSCPRVMGYIFLETFVAYAKITCCTSMHAIVSEENISVQSSIKKQMIKNCTSCV